MEKTSFITPWETYCYKVMPFSLKNVGATYQWAATTLLHDLINKEVEVYVDDMIVKSKDCEGHVLALRKFFERIQFYKLWLNPKKCAFGVTFEKKLGFIVSQRGLEVDPEIIKEVVEMKPPRIEKGDSRISGEDTVHQQVYSLTHHYMWTNLLTAQEGGPNSVECTVPRSLWEDQELSNEATNTCPTISWKAIVVVSYHYRYINAGFTCSIPRGD